jgi:hypothetical protein
MSSTCFEPQEDGLMNLNAALRIFYYQYSYFINRGQKRADLSLFKALA